MTDTMPARHPAVLRRLNAALILKTVRARKRLSRSEIARATGLSKPTVNGIVELLIRHGYIREYPGSEVDRPNRPGPRPRLLEFCSDLGHVLGVDIGADKMLALVANLDGDVVASERRRTGDRARLGPEAVLEEVYAVAETAVESSRIARSSLKAVAIGTPGVVDPGTGRVTLAPQLAGWEGINPSDHLKRFFDCPVFVEKELHLSMLGERWRGAAVRTDDAVYIQLGIGVGAGLLIGGEVYRGAQGAAGEIGYMPLLDGLEPTRYGFGSFEWSTGGVAFARLGRSAACDDSVLLELAGGNPEMVDAKIVFEAARRGDEAAATIIIEVVRRLAHGVAALVCALNPETVIIGGGISRAGDALLKPFEQQLRALVPVPPRVVLSSLGDEAVALGALRLALTKVDERLYESVAAETS